ncbi:MAG: tetraacyldisaccharide 4'-kinase, partial [Proteobacteria bacterium]|nr:tetraacyldisaccharide 4'-kinase [Pseudomonadota bacterium]
VQYLLEKYDVDIVLCDDGLQHYALARDMEIVVMDEQRRMGNGWCLPAGPLREPEKRLKQVDHILYRGSEDPQHGVSYRSQALVNLLSAEEIPLSPTQLGARVHALAGIGQPEQFFAGLERQGFTLCTHSFADHHSYSAEDFVQFIGKPIIMTEKDAVKCRQFVQRDAWYLKISAQLPDTVKTSVLNLAKSKRQNY